MVKFEDLIVELISEIELFIMRVNNYVRANDWGQWDIPALDREDAKFQMYMQDKLSIVQEKMIGHKRKYEAFKNSNKKRVFVELDNILETQNLILNRIKERIANPNNNWMGLLEGFKSREDIEENYFKQLLSEMRETHEEGKFQIDAILKLDSAIDKLEAYYGLELDNEESTLKLRGGDDMNPMTEYYLKNKTFTNISNDEPK